LFILIFVPVAIVAAPPVAGNVITAAVADVGTVTLSVPALNVKVFTLWFPSPNSRVPAPVLVKVPAVFVPVVLTSPSHTVPEALLTASVAPEAIETVAKSLAAPMVSTPPATVVVPEYLIASAPPRVRLPAPRLLKAVPPIAAFIVAVLVASTEITPLLKVTIFVDEPVMV
jgi:hypothetical protein